MKPGWSGSCSLDRSSNSRGEVSSSSLLPRDVLRLVAGRPRPGVPLRRGPVDRGRRLSSWSRPNSTFVILKVDSVPLSFLSFVILKLRSSLFSLKLWWPYCTLLIVYPDCEEEFSKKVSVSCLSTSVVCMFADKGSAVRRPSPGDDPPGNWPPRSPTGFL